jgi:hypothetical protein
MVKVYDLTIILGENGGGVKYQVMYGGAVQRLKRVAHC